MGREGECEDRIRTRPPNIRSLHEGLVFSPEAGPSKYGPHREGGGDLDPLVHPRMNHHVIVLSATYLSLSLSLSLSPAPSLNAALVPSPTPYTLNSKHLTPNTSHLTLHLTPYTLNRQL